MPSITSLSVSNDRIISKVRIAKKKKHQRFKADLKAEMEPGNNKIQNSALEECHPNIKLVSYTTAYFHEN